VKNLATAIFSKISGSAFETSIGGRLYQGAVPKGQNPQWPYSVFFGVSDVPADTFTEKLEDVYVQFSVFSSGASTGEAHDTVANLRALFDDATLSITGNVHLMMQRVGGDPTPRPVFDDTESGEGQYWQMDTEYRILIKRN
jgi:hypothetical protein